MKLTPSIIRKAEASPLFIKWDMTDSGKRKTGYIHYQEIDHIGKMHVDDYMVMVENTEKFN